MPAMTQATMTQATMPPAPTTAPARPAPPPPTLQRAELPPPRTEPIGRDAPVLRRLIDRCEAFAAALGDSEVRYRVATGSWADTGYWVFKMPVTLFALDDALLLWAAGPRPMAHRVGFDQLADSRYHHVTGRLLLDPAADLRVRSIKLRPEAAYQVLAQVFAGDDDT